MMKKGFAILSIFVCVLFAFKANAQMQNSDLVLEINPRYPKANEEVKASISTYSTDLNNARISWILNGETILEGIGKKNFAFKVGGSDFETSLEVKINTINGSSLSKKILISPANVDILWEAYNSYTPPFYKGKALAQAEGMIKIVAIPEISNRAGFNYKWKLDYKNKPSASGYEKNYFVYQNSYLEDSNLTEVSVSDIFGNGVGQGKITVKPDVPKIVFYKKDPILGTRWENSINDYFSISKNGETLVAEPYFFSNKDLSSTGYTFTWYLNGEKIQTPVKKNELSVKQESGTSGSATIKIDIKNNKTLFQNLEKKIDVNF